MFSHLPHRALVAGVLLTLPLGALALHESIEELEVLGSASQNAWYQLTAQQRKTAGGFSLLDADSFKTR